MKILLAGAAGQLARQVISLSESQGHEVIPHDRGALDITDFSAVNATVADVRPDIVINCAAYNDVDQAETQWQAAFMVNGIGVKNLALACKQAGVPLMHFSTDYVFDGESDKPYTIASLPNPINSYGHSKLLGEEMLREHGDRYYIIRTSWVFGAGKSSFPLKLMEWASGKRVLKVVDDQVSSPTYTADLAGAALKLAETENYGLYHVTNSDFTSRYDWARFILAATGWDGEVLPVKSSEFDLPARRPRYSVLDSFPLSNVIGELLPDWRDATERFLKEVS